MSRIVIAGAGFAGVQAALTIAKATKDHQITLVNDTQYHSFHADLYEVATAVLSKERRVDFKNLSGTVNIPLRQIFQRFAVNIICEPISEIDMAKNTLATQTQQVPYDFLVLALGSKANFFGIPGAFEYSHPFKTTEDALNIRNDIEELVSKNDEQVTVAVAGGGLSGMEIAIQMTSFMAKVAYKYQKPVGKVVIIEGSPNVMAGTSRWAQGLGMKRLYENNVIVYTQSHIEKVTGDEISCSGNKKIPYHYLIWTTGIVGNNLDGRLHGVQPTSRGQLAVEPDLRLKEYPQVYVVGDLAHAEYESGKPVPSTAWAAIGMGKHAGENVLRQLQARKPRAYHPQFPMFVVPLGKKQGLAVIGPIQIAGVIAWAMKRLVSLKYFLSILPMLQAITLWREGVKIYIHND